MLHWSRLLTSAVAVWTHRSALLFGAESHLPVLSDPLSLKLRWDQRTRTSTEVCFGTPPCPGAEKRNRGRWRDLPQCLGGHSMAADSKDTWIEHCFRKSLSSTLPAQSFRVRLQYAPSWLSVRQATLTDFLSLPQDLNPARSGRVHTPGLHDSYKTILLECQGHGNGKKPWQTDLSTCLLSNSLNATSKLPQNHVFSVMSGPKNHNVQAGSFHKDFFSNWAGITSKPWDIISLKGHPSAQSRHLHQGDPGPMRQPPGRDILSAENEARCRRALEANIGLYERERAKGRAHGGQRGWAAVLVSLCSVGGEPAFLFTLRSSTLKGRHKGDVSFAGGKQDPSDRDVVDTALREAREELGVTVAASSVWGVLKPLRDFSGMLIAPVLANLGPLEALSFHPNPGEVEEIFTISLAHVCSPKNRGYTNFRVGDRYGYTLPVFLNAKHRVWGLTALALEHTLKVIVAP
ncbi:hypothetical protein AGOR_G00130300 [Albula goreensis]|uniref:Nudix hydrolase domain-containing protein n=1 Tax=Albula goreensis TaxID=1534307 RepID=A0A8T3D936_9TELE|nr:hypothetical protein AGOR_G00130300 [Albula goreensis]